MALMSHLQVAHTIRGRVSGPDSRFEFRAGPVPIRSLQRKVDQVMDRAEERAGREDVGDQAPSVRSKHCGPRAFDHSKFVGVQMLKATNATNATMQIPITKTATAPGS